MYKMWDEVYIDNKPHVFLHRFWFFSARVKDSNNNIIVVYLSKIDWQWYKLAKIKKIDDKIIELEKEKLDILNDMY